MLRNSWLVQTANSDDSLRRIRSRDLINMSKISRSKYLRVFGVILLLVLCACAQQRNLISQPVVPQTLDFKPQQPQHWTTSQGISVYYFNDDELPLVKARLFVPGGTIWEPGDRAGALSVMVDQMRAGGAGNLSADQLDARLESLAATISSSAGAEYLQFAFGCLSSDLDQVSQIYRQVLTAPLFDKSRIELWRGQMLDSIRRRTEQPFQVASIAFRQLLFADSSYARVLDADQVNKISRENLLELYRKSMRLNGAVFVISGKLDNAQAHALVDRIFADWNPVQASLPAPPPLPKERGPEIAFIKLPLEQSSVIIGQRGVERLSPDYPAIVLFNLAFGSGDFGSALMKRIRTELGLAYGVFGGIEPALVKGVNSISLQTKAATTGQALEESLKVLKEVQQTPISQEDLSRLKSQVSNAFVFKFDSPEETLARRAVIELLKYPVDYDETYLPKVMAVSAQDVQNVAQKRWNMDNLTIVVVGNDQALASLQSVLKSPLLKNYHLKTMVFDQKLRGI